jgi:hypothetical protein
MATPANALQAAIYTRLTGFAALTSLVGSNVFDFVPEDAQPPYVVIGDDTAVDWGTDTTNGWDATVTIHSWDFEKAGRKSVKAILSAIYDALHRQESSLSITGFHLVLCQCEFEHTLQDTSVLGEEDRFYHGIQRYRVLIQA